MPTYRHEALPAYQGGRHFDRELLDQLDLMPQLVEAMGFTAKADGYEADDFLAAVAFEEARGGTALVASGDRDTFQLVSERTTVLQPQVGGGALARIGPADVRERYGVEPAQVPDFNAPAATHRTRSPARAGSGRKRPRRCSPSTEASKPRSSTAASLPRRTRSGLYRHIATMDREAPLPALDDQQPTWPRATELARASGGLGRLVGRLEAPSTS